MKFDFYPVRSLLAVLKNKSSNMDALSHPAFQTIVSHSARLGEGVTLNDISAALMGQESPYFGMQQAYTNVAAMETLLEYVVRHQDSWLQEIQTAVSKVFPPKLVDPIIICPIIGYDAGIGHNNHVCVNINRPVYWNRPWELLYVIIHEACHAAHENYHPLPSLHNDHLSSKELYQYLFQYEGYGVWTPLSLRQKNNHPGLKEIPTIEDYLVLSDPREISRHVAAHDQLVVKLENLPLSDFLDSDVWSQRLTYRVGAAMIREIEEHYGLGAVQRGAAMPPAEFIRCYTHLLEKYRF